MTRPSNRLADLNGWTIPLLKLNLVLVPIVATALLTWGIWVTAEIYASKEARKHCVTKAEASDHHAELKEWVRTILAKQ